MNSDKKIDISWSQEKLGSFINQKSPFSLFSFAVVVAHVVMGLPCDCAFEVNKDNLLKIRLGKIRKNQRYARSLLELSEIYLETRSLGTILPKLELGAQAIQTVRANELFAPRRGHPIENKYMLAAMWIYLLKREGRIPWSSIVRMLNWFHGRAKGAIYQKELEVIEKIGAARRDFKKQCSLLIDNYPKLIAVYLRTAIYKSRDKKYSPNAVRFYKKRIEVDASLAINKKTISIMSMREFDDAGKFGEYQELEGPLPTDGDRPIISFLKG